MSNYYQMRDGKNRLAVELKNRGWDVLGYTPSWIDEDMGCDYPYHAASWSGLATKNGFTLCVDINEWDVKSNSGKEIYTYTKENISSIDYSKIESLKNMTVEKGCTQGEADNAKVMIEKIYAKSEQNDIDRESTKILQYVYPTFQNHPSKVNSWHIEKSGSIYAKGNGITKFAEVPEAHIFDINTMKYIGHRTSWNGEEKLLSDDQEKAVKSFKAFILKIERIINSENAMGDGTATTEKEGKEQAQNEKMEKVIEKVTKTVLKMVEVTDRKEIKEGDYLTLAHHGHYWKVTREYMQNGTWKGVADTRKAFVYELVGSELRGYQALKNAKRYYDFESRMLKSLEEGKIKIYELKNVEVTEEVEKWIRVKAVKTAKDYEVKENAKSESQNPKVTEVPVVETEQADACISSVETENTVEVILNEELNGVEIKFSFNPSAETIKTIKLNGFRWNGKTSVWYAKQSPDTINFANSFITPVTTESKVNSPEVTEEVAPTTEPTSPYTHDKIEEGYMYNCHFKEWDLSMNEIQNYFTTNNISFIDMGNKIGFENVDYNTMLTIKELNDKNKGILFIDSKTPTEQTTSEISEEDIQTAESLFDYSTKIMEFLNLVKMEYVNNNDYKLELIKVIKDHNFKITNGLLKHLNNEGFTEFEKILKGLLTSENDAQNTIGQTISEDIENTNTNGNSDIKTVPDVPVIDFEKVREEKQEQNKSEVKNNMNSLLNKFKNIKVENVDRIASEDKIFCEKQEKIYNDLKIVYMTLMEQLQPIFAEADIIGEEYKTVRGNNTYKQETAKQYSLCNYDIENKIHKMKDKFINVICSRFMNKYNITIDVEKITNKYKNTFDITYNNVIDEVFTQLGGLTFIEKESKEIKDKLKEHTTSYNDKGRVIVNKAKVIIDSYLYIDTSDIKWGGIAKVSYSSDDKLTDLIKGIQYFNTGSSSLTDGVSIYDVREEIKKSLGTVKELNYDKTKSIKLLKNGKVEVTFSDFKQAEQFANEYLSYNKAS